MKDNRHKRMFNIDSFARRFYCEHARLNQLRWDKRLAKKVARRDRKKDLNKYVEE